MKIIRKYIVYELNNVMGSEQHKALEKVEFSGWKSNSFDTEEEAVQALVEDEKTYEEFVILKEIYITEHQMKEYDMTWWQYSMKWDDYVDMDEKVTAKSEEEAIQKIKKKYPRAKNVKIYK